MSYTSLWPGERAMRGHNLILLSSLIAAGLLPASCSQPGRPTAAQANPSGVWTLVSTVEEDGTAKAAPPMFVITYTVDAEAHTIVNRQVLQVSPAPIVDTRTFSYVVTPEGNWHIADAGPGGRSIEFSVECSPSTLSLSRVWYAGPDDVVPPAPATKVGEPPPTAPVTTVPPPRKLLLTR